MKPIKISFLFFIIHCLQTSIFIQNAHGQKKKDSLEYYSKLALEPRRAIDISKAFNYFSKQSEVELKRKDTSRAIYCIYNIASIEYKKGFYNDSESSAVRALELLELAEKSNYNHTLKKSLFNHLGIMYKETGNPKKAIELYTKSFGFSKTSKDSAIIYNNISNVYKSINETKKARDELLMAHRLLPKIKDTLSKALIIGNLGDIYSRLNKKEALTLQLKALKLRKSQRATSKIYTSYSQLTKHFIRRNDISKANLYATEAYKLANKLGSHSYKLHALGLLIDLKNHNYINEYKTLNDSITKLEEQSLNKFALMKYEKTKEVIRANETELKLKNEELKNEKLITRTILWITIATTIGLLSIFIYFILKSKHKKEKLQQVYDTESRISKKVHDDIANDVFQVMTTLQANDGLNRNIKHDIELIYDKARDISKQLGEIDLEEDYKITLNDLALRYNTDDTNVIVKDNSKIAWDKISKAKKTTIYKVLQELLINMKKHSKASVAVIAFNNKQKKTIINYSDDGIGCELKKSNGLLNVENRIKAVGGNITFESRKNNGFKAKIEI